MIQFLSKSYYLLAMIVVSLSAVGCDKGNDPKAGNATAGSALAADLPKVATARPARQPLLQKTEQPGRIEAFSTTHIHAKVSGFIEQQLVDIGDRVTGPKKDEQGKVTEPGQVLAVLVAPELKDELMQKEAMISLASADIEQARSAVQVAESVTTSAEANVEEFIAGQQKTESEYQRWKSESMRIDSLALSKTVTQKLAEETRQQMLGADASRAESVARIRSAKAKQNEATNDLLLATAIAYTELLRTEQDLAIAKDIVQRSEKLSATTEKFALAGQGLESDYDRARTEVSLRKSDLIRAEELAAVASSRLAELVRWDAGQRLVPFEAQLTPIQLFDRNASPRDLVSLALTKRPELAESRHLVGEAVERLNRERNAPLVPSVLLAASYGGLGGGLGSNLSNYGDRLDADAVAYWEVRQLGVGENAIRREAKSKITQARMREIATMDRIAREVSESHAQVASRSRQIHVVEEAIDAAEKSFTKNWDRIQNGQGLPIEVLQSIQALASSQREYVKVVADYNVAQFTLQRALGWPIDGLENLEIGE